MTITWSIGVGRSSKNDLQRSRFAGVEGRAALSADRLRRLGEALGIAPGEDDAGALGAGAPRGFQADAGAAADDDDSLAEQLRFAAEPTRHLLR